SVPYKAFDGVMDALSRFLMRLPAAEAESLLPLRAALLAQVFPVLRGVESISKSRFQGEVRDPQELRARVFAGVRELLQRVAARHPVVMVVDDVQWADADSRGLFAEAMRAPDAPPLLVLATLRTDPENAAGADAAREALAVTDTTIRLPLAKLSAEEAEALASELIQRMDMRMPI